MSQRIAHFVDTEFFGGAEQVIVDLAAEALRRGDDPLLLHFGHQELSSRIEAIGVPHLIAPAESEYRSIRTLHRFAREMRRFLAAQRVDVLHSHLFGSVLGGALATAGGGVRHVGTLHDSYTFTDRPVMRHAVTACSMLGTRVVAVSPTVRAAARPGGLLPRARVRIIENGVPVPETPTPERRAEVREALGISDGELLFVVVARLVPIKGLDVLLRAWADAALPGARLALVGEGPEDERLRALAGELDISESVEFLGFRRDVPDLLFAADVFVLSSHSEGLSCSLLEAMAHRLACVATAVGGNPRLVVPDRTGLLVPPGDVDALSGALTAMSSNAVDLGVMGLAGRQRVEEHFSARATFDAYWALYRDA